MDNGSVVRDLWHRGSLVGPLAPQLQNELIHFISSSANNRRLPNAQGRCCSAATYLCLLDSLGPRDKEEELVVKQV